jgi:hypothetical protein
MLPLAHLIMILLDFGTQYRRRFRNRYLPDLRSRPRTVTFRFFPAVEARVEDDVHTIMACLWTSTCPQHAMSAVDFHTPFRLTF